MHPSNIVLLEFHPERDELCYGKELRDGLSVALRMGRTLWLANDESVSLERLTLCEADSTGRSSFAREHRQYALHDYLPLPLPPHGETRDDINEADIEGLACDGKYLWIAGSHSLRRRQPMEGEQNERSAANVRVSQHESSPEERIVPNGVHVGEFLPGSQFRTRRGEYDYVGQGRKL